MSQTSALRVSVGALPSSGLRLRLEKIRWTDASFLLYAFLNLPDERVDEADLDDPHFADMYTMYGAGDRPSGRAEVFLEAIVTLRRPVIERVGRATDNVVVLAPRQLDGAPLDASLLEFATIRTEPLERR